MFTNRVLLITGGTGTFGDAVLRRFLGTEIKEIRVFSRDEKKQEEVRLHYNDPKIKYYIGDVRDYDSIAGAMVDVDYVFHAAALKQVPSCEFYPFEALKTNAMGAENMMNAAIAHRVKRVIVLSTDKAVYPINAMGISKAMMEKLMVAKSRLSTKDGTVLCGTRYGNVMASRGSVIPLFELSVLMNLRNTHTGILLLPPVKRLLRHPHLPDDLSNRRTVDSLAKRKGTLCFREPLFHDLVLLSGCANLLRKTTSEMDHDMGSRPAM
jgi:FlaA1/EpsC-like NDP-sugar epimerase